MMFPRGTKFKPRDLGGIGVGLAHYRWEVESFDWAHQGREMLVAGLSATIGSFSGDTQQQCGGFRTTCLKMLQRLGFVLLSGTPAPLLSPQSFLPQWWAGSTEPIKARALLWVKN